MDGPSDKSLRIVYNSFLDTQDVCFPGFTFVLKFPEVDFRTLDVKLNETASLNSRLHHRVLVQYWM